jgi:hypothetical protein
MVELVQAAESEIHKRRLELSKDQHGTQEEREDGLRVLQMDAAAWRERQNLAGTRQPGSDSYMILPTNGRVNTR